MLYLSLAKFSRNSPEIIEVAPSKSIHTMSPRMAQELEASGCPKAKFLMGLKREDSIESTERRQFLSQATEPGNHPSYSKTDNWHYKIKQAN